MSLLTLRTGWRALVGLAIVAVLCQSSPASAQTTTTGRIVGTVVDPQGAAVPGVTVTATSPQLQGSRVSVTDSSGEFRFLTFPPGTYHIKAELSGFQTVERADVQVNTNSTVTLPFTMAVAGVSQSCRRRREHARGGYDEHNGRRLSPTAEVYNNLPMRRDFYAIARLAPGASPDAIGAARRLEPSIRNRLVPAWVERLALRISTSSTALNVTGMQGGEQTKTINMDFVQEVQVMTTGLNAEYGRMNGGIISVVTQSGGNAFHGSGFGFYEGSGLVSDNSTTSQRAQTTTTILNTKPIRDGGGSLGGYFLKDKLWFFGAFDRTASRDQRTIIRALSAPGSPALGSQVPSDVTTNNYAAKLTWRASNNHSVWVSTNGEPSTRDGYVFAIAGPPSTWQRNARARRPEREPSLRRRVRIHLARAGHFWSGSGEDDVWRRRGRALHVPSTRQSRRTSTRAGFGRLHERGLQAQDLQR